MKLENKFGKDMRDRIQEVGGKRVFVHKHYGSQVGAGMPDMQVLEGPFDVTGEVDPRGLGGMGPRYVVDVYFMELKAEEHVGRVQTFRKVTALQMANLSKLAALKATCRVVTYFHEERAVHVVDAAMAKVMRDKDLGFKGSLYELLKHNEPAAAHVGLYTLKAFMADPLAHCAAPLSADALNTWVVQAR